MKAKPSQELTIHGFDLAKAGTRIPAVATTQEGHMSSTRVTAGRLAGRTVRFVCGVQMLF
jgi:hypothetical protein